MLKTDMEWISLDEFRYVSEKPASGVSFVEGSYVLNYWINIPNEADVGVYRGIIQVSTQEQIEYLNVKIVVQNSIINSVYKNLINPKYKWIYLSVFIFVILVILGYTFFRTKMRSRR